tara:strand:+ start:1184 stop:1618 length:435 start_codon:yes stop_codon:yes gene_type:complete
MDNFDFTHITADGTTLKADEMETKHLFNCIKMWYNHLAVIVGFQDIWFGKKKAHIFHTWENEPQKGIDILKRYMYEFEKRDDKEPQALEKYCLMKNFLTGRVHHEIEKKMKEQGIKQWEFPETDILKLVEKRRDNEQRQLTNGS